MKIEHKCWNIFLTSLIKVIFQKILKTFPIIFVESKKTLKIFSIMHENNKNKRSRRYSNTH